MLAKITDEIRDIPNLYVALDGSDLNEFAIKMRSVLEVCSQILRPEQQVQFPRILARGDCR